MVRILAIGDPHGVVPKNMAKIIYKNKIDLIICVGDYGFTPEKPWLEESWKGVSRKDVDRSYRDVVNKFCSYGISVLTTRGNMLMNLERRKVASSILYKNKNLINKWTGKVKVKGENFVFFDNIYEMSTIMKGNEKLSHYKNRMKSNFGREAKLNNLLKENRSSILIAHNPPYGVVDKAYNGKHVGSKIIFDAVKKNGAKLVLCGHIHEARGKGMIGKVPVYNLGWHGDYAVLDLQGDKVKLIESNFIK